MGNKNIGRNIPQKKYNIKEIRRIIMTIKVNSNVFKEGDPIPDRYACKGVNISPPLEWEAV